MALGFSSVDRRVGAVHKVPITVPFTHEVKAAVGINHMVIFVTSEFAFWFSSNF
jgi:hypothetical protein